MKVDYLIGRRVTAAADAISEEETWDWAIVFEGDIRVGHKGNVPAPTAEIDDTVLGMVDEQGAWTTMSFFSGSPAGLVAEIKAQTKTLTIKLPEEAEARPIAEPIDPTVDLPDDPSIDRVAAGPVKTDD